MILKNAVIAASLLAWVPTATAAVSVLYSENFDQVDGGYVFSPETQVSPIPSFESWGAVQSVVANQLSTTVGTAGGSTPGHGGLRFGGATTRFNWATGAVGSSITGAGGFTVAFNWTESGLTGDRWIGYKVGTPNADNLGINTAPMDYSILFKDSGKVQSFDTGITTNDLADGTIPGTTHSVLLTYLFSSFAAGSTVNFTANVDGSTVVASTFTWDTADDMRMEFQANNAGELIDNFVIATVPEPSSAGLLLGGLALLACRRRR